jgi:hypothetical protein
VENTISLQEMFVLNKIFMFHDPKEKLSDYIKNQQNALKVLKKINKNNSSITMNDVYKEVKEFRAEFTELIKDMDQKETADSSSESSSYSE